MNQLPRFAILRSAIYDYIVRLEGSELHHLRDVRRLVPGNAVTLIDDTDHLYAGRIERFGPDYADISIRELEGLSGAPAIILAAGLIKGPRMDLLVEKAVELGASELIPLLTTRSVVRAIGEHRTERWRRLALTAAKQSLAPRRMVIQAPVTIAQLVGAVPQDTLTVVCAMDGAPLSAIVRETKPRRIMLACGPEGGFDPHELTLLGDAGFRLAGLGTNRLRSETAALAALSIVAGAIYEIARRID